jgi:nucleoside-diphosphate-sugar epimerase
MRIFLTGASGWIGSAVVPALLAAGHTVSGLARTDASADALMAAGVDVQRGALDDLGTLRRAAEDAEAVIHLAFKHDIAFSGDFQGAADADRQAIETFGEVLAGTNAPFLIASGTLGLAPGGTATEQDGRDAEAVTRMGFAGGRLANAQATLALADRGIRSAVVRLPPTVHGAGDHGFLATLVAIARDKGASGYIGNGAGRWPATHRLDAAELFVLALDKAPAGSVLHAVAEEGVPTRRIAEAIGRSLELPAVSIPADQAGEHFGWLGGFFGVDSPASSTTTRELLGWQPSQPGVIQDLDAGHYVAEAAGVTH